MEIWSKRGQAEVITTVLIILLVLAAIVIVWQGVNSTVSKAGSEVESQSECLGFFVTLGEIKAGGQISGYSNKDVQSLTFYVNGASVSKSGPLSVGKSYTVNDLAIPLVSGDIITAAGIINNQLCDGKISQKV